MQRRQDRPPGVAKEAWIPINERVGFVVVPLAKGPTVVPRDALLLVPPVSGYFMLKSAAGWSRIVIVDPLHGPATAG